MSMENDLLQDLMVLTRAAQLVLQEEVLESLRESVIGPTKMSLMRLLKRTRRQSVNDLARFLGQTKAAASQNIDSLVKADMVKREQDNVDRRCVWISLTPRGSRVLKKAETRQQQALERAITGLSRPMLQKTSKAMRALANSILASSESKADSCLQCCAYNTAGCMYDREDWSCQYRKRTQKK